MLLSHRSWCDYEPGKSRVWISALVWTLLYLAWSKSKIFPSRLLALLKSFSSEERRLSAALGRIYLLSQHENGHKNRHCLGDNRLDRGINGFSWEVSGSEISVIIKWLHTVQGLPKHFWSPEEGEFNGYGETSKRRVRNRPGPPSHVILLKVSIPCWGWVGAINPKLVLMLSLDFQSIDEWSIIQYWSLRRSWRVELPWAFSRADRSQF